jgi:hypothetical protein
MCYKLEMNLEEMVQAAAHAVANHIFARGT